MADISVIGLGRLGLPLAAVLASRGFNVVGVDTDQRARAIANRQIPFVPPEPQLEELLTVRGRKRPNLTAIPSTSLAVKVTETTIIIVNTPSEPNGEISSRHVLSACTEIGAGLREKDEYHLIIISSTVMPGTCEGLISDVLETISGKQVGKHFGLCYCPEFVALGKIVKGFLQPDFVVIGSSDSRADSAAAAMYKRLCINDPPIHHMSLTSAEITKIGLNVSVIMKMTAAAQITWMCQRYPGADADSVLQAIGDDSRIGHAFFSKILWPGGPCFPRDSQAFVWAASAAGQTVPVAEAVSDYLNVQIGEMATLVKAHAKGRPIGILGLTYKAGVDSTVGSYGQALADELARKGCEVQIADPHIAKTPPLKNVLDSCAVLVVAVEHPEFKILEQLDLSGKVIIDCRGFLDESKISAKYVRQGRGS